MGPSDWKLVESSDKDALKAKFEQRIPTDQISFLLRATPEGVVWVDAEWNVSWLTNKEGAVLGGGELESWAQYMYVLEGPVGSADGLGRCALFGVWSRFNEAAGEIIALDTNSGVLTSLGRMEIEGHFHRIWRNSVSWLSWRNQGDETWVRVHRVRLDLDSKTGLSENSTEEVSSQFEFDSLERYGPDLDDFCHFVERRTGDSWFAVKGVWRRWSGPDDPGLLRSDRCPRLGNPLPDDFGCPFQIAVDRDATSVFVFHVTKGGEWIRAEVPAPTTSIPWGGYETLGGPNLLSLVLGISPEAWAYYQERCTGALRSQDVGEKFVHVAFSKRRPENDARASGEHHRFHIARATDSLRHRTLATLATCDPSHLPGLLTRVQVEDANLLLGFREWWLRWNNAFRKLARKSENS